MTQTTAGSSVRERYAETTARSAALFERATASLPGGNSRTTIFIDPYPCYVERGEGCRIWDADGNERIDFINNYTSLILGHSHPRVVEALQEQAARFVSVAAPSELEIELAEAIKERLPSIDLIRFGNSGTEGTMMAIRAARAFTGRSKIVKFEGGYHGTHDYAVVDAGAAGAAGTGTTTQGAGIPEAVADTVVIAPFNDPDATERVLAAHRDELAAVIVEPVMGAAGVIPADESFLVFLRELTQSLGALLVFDEVISFRVGYGGAQGRYGVRPDLTTMGKIIGGGLAGRRLRRPRGRDVPVRPAPSRVPGPRRHLQREPVDGGGGPRNARRADARGVRPPRGARARAERQARGRCSRRPGSPPT